MSDNDEAIEGSPIEGPPEAGESHTGRVKWFDPVKGFGFIATEMEGDILVHKSVLHDAGRESLSEGATVVCETVRREKGLQAVRLVSVDENTSTPRPPRPRGPRRAPMHRARERRDEVVPEGEVIEVEVKWFNRTKGYGFVTRGEGTDDIFIHAEVLRRRDMEDLVPGQRLRVRVGQGHRGPLVADVES